VGSASTTERVRSPPKGCHSHQQAGQRIGKKFEENSTVESEELDGGPRERGAVCWGPSGDHKRKGAAKTPASQQAETKEISGNTTVSASRVEKERTRRKRNKARDLGGKSKRAGQ